MYQPELGRTSSSLTSLGSRGASAQLRGLTRTRTPRHARRRRFWPTREPGMASHAPASSSWEPLGDTFYRRQDIYSMQWSIPDLSNLRIAGARWGGPLGAV